MPRTADFRPSEDRRAQPTGRRRLRQLRTYRPVERLLPRKPLRQHRILASLAQRLGKKRIGSIASIRPIRAENKLCFLIIHNEINLDCACQLPGASSSEPTEGRGVIINLRDLPALPFRWSCKPKSERVERYSAAPGKSHLKLIGAPPPRRPACLRGGVALRSRFHVACRFPHRRRFQARVLRRL